MEDSSSVHGLSNNRFLSATFLLLSLLLACVIPSVPLQDANAVGTEVAQTVLASQSQTAISASPPSTAQEPPLTATSQPSTITPTQTLTSTLTFTLTPAIPEISVSVPTNCRNGPGKAYKIEGALLVGDIVQIYGRDPTGKYWYIRNPDSTANFCWVWGEYATISGNAAFLPIYTPPPTPTATFTPTPTHTPTPSPDFEIVFDGIDSCTGWWVEFKLKNTGTITFESIGIVARDTVTDVVMASFSDDFINKDGCTTTSRDALNPGKIHIVSSPIFNYDLTGHKLHVTIILCSNPGQSGICITKTVNVKP